MPRVRKGQEGQEDMATKLKVTYADGRQMEILASPRAQVDSERHLRGLGGFSESTQIEASYYLAWASLHRSGREAAEFEPWLDLVTDVTEVSPTEEEERATDPTPAVAASTGSSD